MEEKIEKECVGPGISKRISGSERMGESMLPEAFLVRMQQMLGEEYESFLETFAQERHQALRINALKLQADKILDRTNVVSEEVDEVPGKMEVDSEEADEVPGKMEVDSEEVNEVSEGTDIRGINEIMAVWKPHLSKVPWAENGYYYEAEDFPGKHPYHDAGVYYIQEPSARDSIFPRQFFIIVSVFS